MPKGHPKPKPFVPPTLEDVVESHRIRTGKKKTPPPIVPVDTGALDEPSEALIKEIYLALKGPKTVADRRSLVLKLVASGTHTTDIANLIRPRFGIGRRAVDKDVAWAKDYWVKWAVGKG